MDVSTVNLKLVDSIELLFHVDFSAEVLERSKGVLLCCMLLENATLFYAPRECYSRLNN